MNFRSSFLLIAILTPYTYNVTAQRIHSGSVTHAAAIDTHEGFVVKTNGDTLRGSIWLGGSRFPQVDYAPPKASKYDALNNRKIETDSVAMVRINTDQFGTTPQYTDFIKLKSKHKLYRVVIPGKVSVYDQDIYTDESHRWHYDWDGMLVVKGNDVQTLNSLHQRARLAEIINKFFNMHFTRSDFPTGADAIQWIREHAND